MVGDLADLGVALEALGAVDDRAAGVLEALRPGDVVGLVEAGAQLHEDGDVLARLGGADEALAEVRALGHAIERDLDGDARVVGGGLAHEAQERRHGLVGIRQQDVVVLHLPAHRAREVDHGGYLRLEGAVDAGGVHVVGDVGLEPVDVAEVDGALQVEDPARLEGELPCDEVLELLAELAANLQADGLEALAELEDLLHVLAVVLLLLTALAVGVDVGVARDAQHRGALGDVVAEALVERGLEDVLEQGVAPGLGPGGQRDDARLGARHLDDAEKARLVGAVERAGDEEAAVAQVGEGVARVDDERGDYRREAALEVAAHGGAVLVGVLGGGDAHEALLGEERLDLREAALVTLHEGGQGLEDAVELLGRGLVGLVVARLVLKRGEVGEAAHADHEPLVEVGLDDLAELEALEDGDVGVIGLVEDAVVEAQPADLAVLGVGEVALAVLVLAGGLPGVLLGGLLELLLAVCRLGALLGILVCGVFRLVLAHREPFNGVVV